MKTALQHCQALTRESERLIKMNAAFDRMAKAALSKDNKAFDTASRQFRECKS